MAGEVAGGDGAAYVERVGRAGCFQGLGAAGQGGVEVQGIAEVELALDPGGAGEGDLVVVDGEMALVGGPSGVLEGLCGHVPGDRLGDEAVGRGGADLVREGRDLLVDESGGLSGEPDGGLGDPTGPPCGQVAGGDACPVSGEAVLELERGGDQVAPGVGRDAQGGGQLGDAELGDQGCAGSGERDPGLGAAPEPGRGPGRGEGDGLDRVLLGPGHRGDQDVRLGRVGDRARRGGRRRARREGCRAPRE